MRRHVTIIAGLLATASAPAAVAQPAPQPPAAPAAPATPLTQAQSRAVVAEVRRIIAARYVLPERRPVLDAALARSLAAGRYDVGDRAELAQRINADLDAAGHDRHLNFNYSPRQANLLAQGGGPGQQPSPEAQAAFERQTRSANFGVSELRVLPGNIRYMAYDGFMWTGPDTAAALDTAMRFLSGGDAVIIDLRRNGGGSPQAVQYIISHFLAPNTPLVTFYMNGEPGPDRLSTLAEVPAGRMVGKPLYVLISGGTASAAEEFAGHVGGYHLGELVGANTAGAGFRNDLVPVAGEFVLSVSVGRAVLASTGRDWEAVGHAPTVPTTIEGALDAAQVLALRRIAQDAPEPERPRLLAMADGIEARSQSRAAALPLTAYAGAYGERVVSVDAGRLYMQRGQRARIALIPLGGNVFASDQDPAMRMTFQVSGASAASFEVGPAGGPPQGHFDRTG